MGNNTTSPPRRRHGALAPPPMPPPTEAERIASEEMTRQMREIAAGLHQRNLAAAVRLAQQALGGKGELVEHFAELGRRFGHTLDAPTLPPKPWLRVVAGGAA